jgi:hypothetical protein
MAYGAELAAPPGAAARQPVTLSPRLSYARLLGFAGAEVEAEAVLAGEPAQAQSMLVERQTPFGDAVGSDVAIKSGNEAVTVYTALHRSMFAAYLRADSEAVSGSREELRNLIGLSAGSQTTWTRTIEAGWVWAASGDGSILGLSNE